MTIKRKCEQLVKCLESMGFKTHSTGKYFVSLRYDNKIHADIYHFGKCASATAYKIDDVEFTPNYDLDEDGTGNFLFDIGCMIRG